MSDTRFVPVDEVVREEAREPAKLWCNWWRVNQAFTCEETNEVLEQGAVYPGVGRFPSQEEAQSAAKLSMYSNTGWDGTPIWRIPDTYLGAYPEGERP